MGNGIDAGGQGDALEAANEAGGSGDAGGSGQHMYVGCLRAGPTGLPGHHPLFAPSPSHPPAAHAEQAERGQRASLLLLPRAHPRGARPERPGPAPAGPRPRPRRRVGRVCLGERPCLGHEALTGRRLGRLGADLQEQAAPAERTGMEVCLRLTVCSRITLPSRRPAKMLFKLIRGGKKFRFGS
jgi:hypothetical protein